MAPEMRIIAPIREGNLTREDSVAYAKKHGIPLGSEKTFSIDENLWGRSIEGGVLEDPSVVAPEEIFKWTVQKKKGPETVEITFENGVPIAMNGKSMSGVDLVSRLNNLVGSHGVGRIDMIEDRILGLKARENYECPAAVVLLTAHRDLEGLVLSREELKVKAHVDAAWSELVYRGLWNEPLREALDSRVVGRSSKNALYKREDVSFEDKGTDQREVEGMLKYHAYQASMFEKMKKKE
jgi:argininosuccinate synthase